MQMTLGMADMDIGIFNLNIIRYLTTNILFIWNMRQRLKRILLQMSKKKEPFDFSHYFTLS